jgi:hypothetical protein
MQSKHGQAIMWSECNAGHCDADLGHVQNDVLHDAAEERMRKILVIEVGVRYDKDGVTQNKRELNRW